MERGQSKRPANGVRRTMLDGFVAGASVTAVTAGTWDTPDGSDKSQAAELDDPGELDALFSQDLPEEPRDSSAGDGGPSADPTNPGSTPGLATNSGVVGADVGPAAMNADPVGVNSGPIGTADGGDPVLPRAAGNASPPSPDGPQPRERLRDVARDSRMRIWRRRILITVIAGAVFSIIFTWRLGLTVAVIVAVADTIYRSRTVAASPPGVKITGAQRRTQRSLARMERSGYRALHNRPIPDSEEFIDHLLVGPTGVYAIDSEKWDRRLPIRTRNARQLWHGPDSKKDRLEHARWEAEQASVLLSGNLRQEITVRPAMAVYGPKIPWDIATIRDVDVFDGTRLRKYLRKRGKATTERLSDAEIEKIYRAAMTVLPL